MSTKIILIYFAAITLITFVVYGIDKRKARLNQWRIPESNLLLLAVLGGSPGALLAMKVWHHKTRHAKFRIGVPVILILQIALILFLYYYFHKP